MDFRDRSGRAPRATGDPPSWLIWLAILGLAASAVLWPLLTGRTLTEWMRDVTAILAR